MRVWVLAQGKSQVFRVLRGSTWKGPGDYLGDWARRGTTWQLESGQSAVAIVTEATARDLREDPALVVLGEEE